MKRQFMLAVLVATRLGAQQPYASHAVREARPIQDNSFLMEEAYNQEPAVVQHISNLLFDRRASTWAYALTDEWPLGGQRHQLSVTVPVQSSGDNGGLLGDVAINYRLQLVGSGEARLAVAPRVTIFLPTASEKLGGGTFATQGALAASYVATNELVLHSNAGLTFTPAGESPAAMDFTAGQSVVWLMQRRVNLLLEAVVTNTQDASASGRSTGLTLSPGVRWSYDFASGLQIVPGIAVPLGFQANSGQRGVFLYLSFEHPMPGLKK